MRIPVICIKRADLVNNILVVLKFRNKLMFEVVVHTNLVGYFGISS